MSKTCKVALIGQKFMGRAHSNAYAQVGHFFDLPMLPERELVCGRDEGDLSEFAKKWGWSRHTTQWEDITEDEDIDLVDVSTPNDLHCDPSVAMLAAGKHVACEKPLANSLADARRMATAAQDAPGCKTFVWFNYRRCPAVALAHRFVREGRLGEVYHVRARYLQSWGGPNTPMSWRFDKQRAGSGAHGDLNAHIIDMARFITGDEIVAVHGAIARTFIGERHLPGGDESQSVDVDDCTLFLASFAQGAVASFEATRLAAGHQNRNTIEINGSKGSLRFDFEDMNVLQFHDGFDVRADSGWTRIMCTSAEHHPYASNWWPDAHVIGYEHGFINMAADIMRVLGGEEPLIPLPDFADAYRTQRVLEAALISADQGCTIKLADVS